MKKILLYLALIIFSLTGCVSNKNKLYLLNFGDYINPEIIKEFEKENNCEVVLDVFEANEDAIPLITRDSQYDLVCLSEYAIEQLLPNNIFEKLDKTKLDNAFYSIYENYKEYMAEIDNNEYALPYFWGTQGIVYNKTKLLENNLPLPTKWADLWNEKYKNNLIMSNSLRDLYTCAQYKLGYSMNTKKEQEIINCTNELIKQKPLVQCYVTDQIKEKILSGEGLIAPLLDGDMQFILDSKPEDDIEFIIPEGKLSLYIDNWLMLKSAKNKDLAYTFLDYICKPEIANKNAEYVGYQSCNKAVDGDDYLLMFQQNKYIDKHTSEEIERDLGEALKLYNAGFFSIKSE